MKILVYIIALAGLMALTPLTHADVTLNTIDASTAIDFDSAGSGSSCSAGLSISEQASLEFGAFSADTNGALVIESNTGSSQLFSSINQLGSASPSPADFLITQLSPEDNCSVGIDTSNPEPGGDPLSCGVGSTTISNGSDTMPFYTEASPASGSPAIPPGGSVTWHIGGLLQTNCGSSPGSYSSGSYTGTYTVNVDYL